MTISFEENIDGKQRKPRVVEIIGPAGAGKTTLYNELSRYRDCVRLSNFPDVRKLANAPFFIEYGSRLIPVLFRMSKWNESPLSRREFAWLTILSGWPTVLRKELKENDSVIVLDQGPVYLLSEISEFGPEYFRKPAAVSLWQDLYSRWAKILDVVVWLDAADHDLIERIRSRDKEHEVKNESTETISRFLERYRIVYRRTISSLLANCPEIKILRFDTSRISPEEMANLLFFQLGHTFRSLRTTAEAS